MVDRFWRPLATILVFTGVVSFIGATIVTYEESAFLMVAMGIVTLIPGWVIFVVTRDR